MCAAASRFMPNGVSSRERARPRSGSLASLTNPADRRPGVRSANIHLSTDRTRVVNYAQWDSAEAYQAMLGDETAREHMAAAADLAIGF